MNTLVIVLIAAVVLVCAYAFYGCWVAKTWGINPNAQTPAVKYNDGKDFVPTNGWTVFSHQFSSIAGAGPVTGAIRAAVFGWLPVLLWMLIGGVFFGALRTSALCTLRQFRRQVHGYAHRKVHRQAGPQIVYHLLLAVLRHRLLPYLLIWLPVHFLPLTALPAWLPTAANGRAGTVSIMFMLFAVVFGLIQKKFNFTGWKEFVLGIVFIWCCPLLSALNCPSLLARPNGLPSPSLTFSLLHYADVAAEAAPRDYMTTLCSWCA